MNSLVVDETDLRGTLRDRSELVALAERLVVGALAHASAGGAQIHVPGAPGRFGVDVDGLEGFARSFLAAGFLLAGRQGSDPDGFAERYARGIASGTDPGSGDRWPRFDEHPQAKVEAASIAIILDMTRPWIWDQLGSGVQERVREYLAPAVGDPTYPQINWVWFRLLVQTFLRSIDGPWSEDEMRADLATHDRLARSGGWFADGDTRAFDHYNGWAFHLFPVLWSRMAGAESLAAERGNVDRDRLDRYLSDALALIGADGTPLVQGRSLVYRFAAAAPFWAGALSAVPSHQPGTLRRAALAIVSSFTRNGVPAGDGTLSLGWHGPWRSLAQAYSGPGSPYWAAKGLLGVALPEDHPVWTDAEGVLPIERDDFVFAVEAPGWIVSGTHDDGIARVVNHGTDHAREGDLVGDSPLYARLGYSTATFPLLDDHSWISPIDQCVGLVDAQGRSTHRSGMVTTALGVESALTGRLAIAASVAQAHWLTPADSQMRHGSGYEGSSSVAGEIQTVSVVRGPWEVRCVRIANLTDEGRIAATQIRIGGWAVPAGEIVIDSGQARIHGGGLISFVACDLPEAAMSVETLVGASPVSTTTQVPIVHLPVQTGRWIAAVIGLAGDQVSLPAPISHVSDDVLVIEWGDGRTTIHLSDSLTGATTDRTGRSGLRRSPNASKDATKEAQ